VSTTEFEYLYEQADECLEQFGQNWTRAPSCKGVAIRIDTLQLHAVERHDVKEYAMMLLLLMAIYRFVAVIILWRKTRFAV